MIKKKIIKFFDNFLLQSNFYYQKFIFPMNLLQIKLYVKYPKNI